MTTWLPAIILGWVVLCTVIGMLEPMFNSNSPHIRANDRPVGAIVGLAIGIVTGAVIYAVVRIGAWMIGVGV